MKKLLATILAMTMVLSMLTACGKNETTQDGSLSTGGPVQTEDFSTLEPETTVEEPIAEEPTDGTTDSTADATQPTDPTTPATGTTTTPDSTTSSAGTTTQNSTSSTVTLKPSTSTTTTSKPSSSGTTASKPSSGSTSSSKPASGSTSTAKPSTDTTVQKPSTSTPAPQEPAAPADPTADKNLTDMISSIYAIQDPGLKLQTMSIDISDANALRAYTGLSDASKLKEVYASEAMIGSQAYSLVLVHTNSASDAASVAKDMFNGIDKRKWICVEADDLQTAACGSTVLLIMVSSELADSVTSAQIVSAFHSVCGSELSANYK